MYKNVFKILKNFPFQKIYDAIKIFTIEMLGNFVKKSFTNAFH